MKKFFKFISSRLLYLVIGIFLAIGATYAYATWDDAKTGSSGQLTEGNWNALVDMLETSAGTSGGCFNTFNTCACIYQDGYWAVPCPCTCTPPNCPTGYANVGTPNSYEISSGTSGTTTWTNFQCSRACCKS